MKHKAIRPDGWTGKTCTIASTRCQCMRKNRDNALQRCRCGGMCNGVTSRVNSDRIARRREEATAATAVCERHWWGLHVLLHHLSLCYAQQAIISTSPPCTCIDAIALLDSAGVRRGEAGG